MTVDDIIRDWGLGFFWGRALEALLDNRFEYCERALQDVLHHSDHQSDGRGELKQYDVYVAFELDSYQLGVVIAIHRENPVEAVRKIEELLDAYKELREKGADAPKKEG